MPIDGNLEMHTAIIPSPSNIRTTNIVNSIVIAYYQQAREFLYKQK